MPSCKQCGEEKGPDEFYTHSLAKNGFNVRCKVCCRANAKKRGAEHSEELKVYHRLYNQRRSPEDRRRIYVKSKYGLEWDVYKAMSQECEICGSTKLLGIDHCHDTGRVRGKLCRTCNSALGYLKDDLGLVRKAVEYLERTGHAHES